MSDLTGLPALDVLIGLSFIYFLLSLVTSSLTEGLSALFNIRWKTLRRGLREVVVSANHPVFDDLRKQLGMKHLRVSTDGSIRRRPLGTLSLTDKDGGAREALKSISDESRRSLMALVPASDLELTVRRIRTDVHNWDEVVDRLRPEEVARWIHVALQPSAAFEGNPRLQALWKQTGPLGRRGPSYVPTRVLAQALLDTFAPADPSSHVSPLARAKESLAVVENPVVRRWLQDAVAEAEAGWGEKGEKVIASLERSFDQVMDRVSGWYKRTATIWILVFAAAIVGTANLDSLAIGQRLWKDDALRTAVVAQASGLTSESACPDGQEGETALDRAARCVDDVKRLGLPVGWNDVTTPHSAFEALGKALGLLITVFALTLGAPFWFDTLSKLSRLRTTGKKEDTDSAGESR